MRIAHFADTHLGFQRWGYQDPDGLNQRETDVYAVFNQAVQQMIKRDVDVVIHAGDLFESHHPPTRALQVALDGFGRLKQAGIPVVAIAGNHSTPRSPQAAHVFGLLERFGVHAMWREPGRVQLGDLVVTGVPHDHDQGALREKIKAARPDPSASFNVLAWHAGTEGLAEGGDRETASVELEPEMLNEGASFTYLALGHLHGYDRPTPNACYAGSLERLTFGDRASKKGWIEVDLAAAGSEGFLRLREVKPRPVHQLPPVDATGVEDLWPVLEPIIAPLDLEQAILRVPLIGVERAAWRSFDWAAWMDATKTALHAELEPEYGQVALPTRANLQLGEFLRARVPRGMDAERVVERAEELLRCAGEQLPED
jgi:DNA repair exonuclease SbcCD nuclease subunit